MKWEDFLIEFLQWLLGVISVFFLLAAFFCGFVFGTYAASDDCNDHGHFKYDGVKYECKALEAK